jgi:hypothetical protein
MNDLKHFKNGVLVVAALKQGTHNHEETVQIEIRAKFWLLEGILDDVLEILCH